MINSHTSTESVRKYGKIQNIMPWACIRSKVLFSGLIFGREGGGGLIIGGNFTLLTLLSSSIKLLETLSQNS